MTLPPISDAQYPLKPVAAAYVCRQGRCSAPLETPEALGKLLLAR